MKKCTCRILVGLLALGTVGIPILVVAEPTTDKKGPAAPSGPVKPLEIEGIHNAFQWTDNISSGSCPVGEVSFKALAARGIKTIITVDGATPDAEGAKKYGMRYVHIPVEYSGIAEVDALKIVRAVRDLPGPVFIHCHHGKHRGPAAAALAAIATGGYTNEQAIAALKQTGTGLNYKGLWEAVADFKPPSKDAVDKADNTFPAAAPPIGISGTMVHVDQGWERMGFVKAAHWGVPANHPDIDPAHEALILKESFRELQRLPESQGMPADFTKRLLANETAAGELEAALRANDAPKAAAAFDKVQANCNSCHTLYRDNRLKR